MIYMYDVTTKEQSIYANINQANVIWTIIPETIIGTNIENAGILIAITRIAGVLISTELLAATYYFVVHKRIIRLIREYKLWDRFLAAYSVISLQIIAYISYYWNFMIRTSNTTIIINAIALWLAFVIIYLTAVGIYRSEHPWVIGNR